MSVPFTGLVISSVPGSLYATLSSPSMFYATVFVVAIVVFAYFTNPSEPSFRAFLTEQSFRHHITRLDDPSNSKEPFCQASSVYYPGSHPHSKSDSSHTRFHFANRASLAIRTPSHVYHNFVLFSIALVIPYHATRSSYDGFADTWFLGTFGSWWKGGPLYAWWIDSWTTSKDEEVSKSGLLNFKNLDTVDEFNVLPFSSFRAKASRSSPPRLRNSRHQHDSQDRIQHLQHRPQTSRSTTPPPLPKSASLPLHTTRHPSAVARSQTFSAPVPPSPSSSTSVPSNMFDQSPAVAELLRQIAASRSAVHELRSQLSEFHKASSQQRDLLSQDLELQREKKREEDSTRTELKSKTKNLEDSRRNAESGKRDADKKLKVAETRRDSLIRQIEFLNAEISRSKESIDKDYKWIKRETDEQEDSERGKGETEFLQELARKKAEIKVDEDAVAALNVKAKELEDRIAEDREKLLTAFQTNVSRPLDGGSDSSASHNYLSDTSNQNSDLVWPPYQSSPATSNHSSDQSLNTGISEIPLLYNQHLSPRRTTLSLTGLPISGLSSRPGNKNHRRTRTNFAPFDETLMPSSDNGVLPPTILLSNSLISSLTDGPPVEMEISRSFRSESDPFIVRQDRGNMNDWPKNGGGSDGLMATRPSSMNGPKLFDDISHGIRPGSVETGAYFGPEIRSSRLSSVPRNDLDLQHSVHHMINRTTSEPVSPNNNLTMLPRRWLSAREKKPLNPQAEEFSLRRTSAKPLFKHTTGVRGSFDALNPSTSLAASARSSCAPGQSTAASSSFFSKAFAPSPAERAALGVGTLNASLEKLPSLSDLGSLNSSPAHTHAVPAAVPAPAITGDSSYARSTTWWSGIPRREPKFSPWEDDEH